MASLKINTSTSLLPLSTSTKFTFLSFSDNQMANFLFCVDIFSLFKISIISSSGLMESFAFLFGICISNKGLISIPKLS